MKVRVRRNPLHKQQQYQPDPQQQGYSPAPIQPQQGPPQQGQDPNQDPNQQQYAYGGQAPFGQQNDKPYFSLSNGHYPFDPNRFRTEPFKVSESIDAVPRDQATIEAERGETLIRKKADGGIAQFKIGGKPHSQGGTPLAAEPGDFIFSKTKKMEIGGPILEFFGKNGEGKKKYSPADIAKQYDINKYQALMEDPHSDNLQKKTAEMMIAKFGGKLQALAEVQESKKGFPTGNPNIAKYGGLMKAQHGTQIEEGYAGPPQYRDLDQINENIALRKIAKAYGSTPTNTGSLDVKPNYNPTNMENEVFDPRYINNNINNHGITPGPQVDENWTYGRNEMPKYNPKDPGSVKNFQEWANVWYPEQVQNSINTVNPKTGKSFGQPNGGVWIDSKDGPRTQSIRGAIMQQNQPQVLPPYATTQLEQGSAENMYNNTSHNTSNGQQPDIDVQDSNRIYSGLTPADREAKMLQMLQSTRYPQPHVSIPAAPQLPHVAYEDPSARIAAINSGIAGLAKYSGLTQDGSRQRANTEGYAGKGLNEIAQALSETQGRNVNAFNQNQAQTSDVVNKYNQEKAQAKTQESMLTSNYAKDIATQNNAYLRGIGAIDQQAEAKNSRTAFTNAMYRNQGFQWDPTKQKFVFTPNFNGAGSSGNGSLSNELDYYTSLVKKQYPNITDEEKIANKAIQLMHSYKVTQAMKMGNMTNRTSGPGMPSGYGTGDMYNPMYTE